MGRQTVDLYLCMKLQRNIHLNREKQREQRNKRGVEVPGKSTDQHWLLQWNRKINGDELEDRSCWNHGGKPVKGSERLFLNTKGESEAHTALSFVFVSIKTCGNVFQQQVFNHFALKVPIYLEQINLNSTLMSHLYKKKVSRIVFLWAEWL